MHQPRILSPLTLEMIEDLRGMKVGECIWLPVREPYHSFRIRLARARDEMQIGIVVKMVEGGNTAFIARYD